MPAQHAGKRSRRWWIGLGVVVVLLAGSATVVLLVSRDRATSSGLTISASAGVPVDAATPPETVSPSAAQSPSASPRPSRSPSKSPTPVPSHTATHAATAPAGSGTQTGTTVKFYVTLYGAHDNTPANSADIAYPVLHRKAGGTGTFADPITFATDKSELAVGTKIYYPYLKRYFIMEDDCTECDEDWSGKGPDGGPKYRHIDLWAGDSDDPDVENCESDLTQDGQVGLIVKPTANLAVSTVPLYENGKCYNPRTGK